jgi:hypothetical protein
LAKYRSNRRNRDSILHSVARVPSQAGGVRCLRLAGTLHQSWLKRERWRCAIIC